MRGRVSQHVVHAARCAGHAACFLHVGIHFIVDGSHFAQEGFHRLAFRGEEVSQFGGKGVRVARHTQMLTVDKVFMVHPMPIDFLFDVELSHQVADPDAFA